MWATVLGLMMQRLAARLETVITEHCVDCVQAAVGVDVGNRPGSDDATVVARLGTVITEPCVDCVQAAVGVDVGNHPGSDDATVGGPTGNSHN